METLVLVGTAVSGGSLRGLLEEAVNHFGAERIALWIEKTLMDFPLPCPCGVGKRLTREELQSLQRRFNPRVFFSKPLCAKYFTYTNGEVMHFVLFDDGETIQKKLELADAYHIRHVFSIYPDSL